MGQKHAIANPRSVPRSEIRPGAVVRVRNPEGRMCEGVVHHLNAFHEPYVLPSESPSDAFYAHPADIEDVLGFYPELIGPRPQPGRLVRRRRSGFPSRRHKLR
jgi:hypothetical protein